MPAALCVLLTPVLLLAAPGDFTFLHLSDEHFPHQMATSVDVIQTALTSGSVRLSPFGIESDRPSFAISTGDMTEFGEDGWDAYLRAWANAPFPVYHQTGNHDNTWACLRPRIRALHGANHYSFEHAGCHFVGLDTATPQDPRPSLGRELLLWLEEDLAQVDKSTPVFVFLHHRPAGREFASAFDYERLLDRLKPHNIALLLAGHSHGATAFRAGPFDGLLGGSTFGKIPGYAIVTLRAGKLYAAYRVAAEPEATRELLTKELPRGPSVPLVNIRSPAEGEDLEAGDCRVEAMLGPTEERLTAAQAAVDDRAFLDLTLTGRAATGVIPRQHLGPGAHWIRVGFKSESGEVFTRSTFLYVRSERPQVRWRTFLDGSSKSTPLAVGGRLYLGANDGKVYCLDAATGQRLWTFATGGEVLGQPCAVPAGVCCGSGDGSMYAVDHSGREVWRTTLGSPVYSSPVSSHGLVFVGDNGGKLHCLSARTGRVLWTCAEARYSIESQPFLDEGRGVVYFGAWDEHVYAVKANTGDLVWKVKGEASATRPAPRYYSPADCGPVAVEGKVYIPDRGYQLSIIDAETGQRLRPVAGVSGVSAAPDGGVYLRKTKGVCKLDATGATAWETEVETGFLPTVVASENGKAVVLSDRGLLSCLDDETGNVIWQYQVTPKLWTMSSPCVHKGAVYVSAMDGSVTALACG